MLQIKIKQHTETESTIETTIKVPNSATEITLGQWSIFLGVLAVLDTQKYPGILSAENADSIFEALSVQQQIEYYASIAAAVASICDEESAQQIANLPIQDNSKNNIAALFNLVFSGITNYTPDQNRGTGKVFEFYVDGEKYRIPHQTTARPLTELSLLQGVQALEYERIFDFKGLSEFEYIAKVRELDLHQIAVIAQRVLPSGNLEPLPLDMAKRTVFLAAQRQKLSAMKLSDALDCSFFLLSFDSILQKMLTQSIYLSNQLQQVTNIQQLYTNLRRIGRFSGG